MSPCRFLHKVCLFESDVTSCSKIEENINDLSYILYEVTTSTCEIKENTVFSERDLTNVSKELCLIIILIFNQSCCIAIDIMFFYSA